MSMAIVIVGWLGAALLVVAYALLSLGKMDGNGAVFQLLNLAGSAAVCVNSSVNGAWPSATLNVVWMVIGAVALARLRKSYSGGPEPHLPSRAP